MSAVTPGLVCAHHHLYSALARGMPAPPRVATSFAEILEQVWWRLDTALDLEMIRWSAMLGALEALENGTTAIIDHHESPNAIEGSLDVIAEACAEVGVRSVLAYGITDRHGPDGARRGLAENERFIRAGGRGLVGIHAAFTCSDASLRAAADLAADLGVGVHIHVCEGVGDVDAPRRLAGLTRDDWLLAHCVHLPTDHALRGTILHNPMSNLNNAVGYANPARFATGWPWAPTGSAATSWRPSGWPTSCSARSTSPAGPSTAWSWLEAGWDLVPEARGDEVTWSYDPMDPWHIAFTPGIMPRRITIDGEVVFADGRPTRVDADEIRARAREQAARLHARLCARRSLTREHPMSDRFRPLSMEQLTSWVFTELEQKGSIFNVPASAVFAPRPDHRFRRRELGVELDTPWGVAAGPHTQMAQNIVAAWLAGARLIELKTVQTLDELEVNKPCIDVEDEGYNVEWSQELRVHQSFDEYLRAWVLVHALHRALGFPGERPGVVFNMSVGYNLEGIRRPNVQWYLDAMADASAWLPAYVDVVARRFPAVREIDIPARISDSVTLSTMHGCPPDEIERISQYLIEERGLHTTVKCNPTLLGAERVRGIVNEELGYRDVPIPDEAFGHDLRWEDAVPMFERLRAVAAGRGVAFGLKLSNTLEVRNWRGVFDRDPTMYLSGRALHAVTVNLAARISDAFEGSMPLSFAGGADAFNLPDLLAGGLRTVTVCSDLLKTGGYLRLLQYPEQVDAAFDAVGATGIDDFVRRRALAGGLAPDARRPCRLRPLQPARLRRRASWSTGGTRRRRSPPVTRRPRARSAPSTASPRRAWTSARSTSRCPATCGPCARATSPRRPGSPGWTTRCRPSWVASATTTASTPASGRTSTSRSRSGRSSASSWTRRPEGRPSADGQGRPRPAPERSSARRVAIVGAGPAGLAAAEWLARAGAAVTILEEHPYPGGMVGGAIPAYRLPQAQIAQDLAVLQRLGVELQVWRPRRPRRDRGRTARGRVRRDLRRGRRPAGQASRAAG